MYLAVIDVELARRRSDLARAQEATRGLEAALGAAAEADELPVPPDYWALALMNLGIAELWAGRPDDARQHLEDALGRTRRISRPFIEIGCLAHLAIAAPLTGQPLPLALELSERAIAIAEEHGWTSQSMTTGAFAMAGMALVRMGRFAEAERHLARAEESLRAAADPGTEVVLHHARGMLRFGAGPLRRSAGGVRARAEPGTAARRRARVHGRRARPGSPGTGANGRHGVRAARARRLEPGTAQPRRDAHRARGSGARTGQPGRQAVEALAPVIDGSAPALYERWARVEALLLDATARDRLGDRRAAEESLEAALELAEPEGLILPFMLWPSRELLERHPRHRTAHATLISTILDTLAGRAAPQRGPAGAAAR